MQARTPGSGRPPGGGSAATPPGHTGQGWTGLAVYKTHQAEQRPCGRAAGGGSGAGRPPAGARRAVGGPAPRPAVSAGLTSDPCLHRSPPCGAEDAGWAEAMSRAGPPAPPAVPEEEAGVNQSLRRKGSQEAHAAAPQPGDCAPGKRWAIPGTLRVVLRGRRRGRRGWGMEAGVGGRRPETAHSREPSPAERHRRPGCVMARPRPRFHLLSLHLRPVHAQVCLRVCATTLPVYT